MHYLSGWDALLPLSLAIERSIPALRFHKRRAVAKALPRVERLCPFCGFFIRE